MLFAHLFAIAPEKVEMTYTSSTGASGDGEQANKLIVSTIGLKAQPRGVCSPPIQTGARDVPSRRRSLVPREELEAEINRLAKLSIHMSGDEIGFRAVNVTPLREPDEQGVNWTVGFVDGAARDHLEAAINLARTHFNIE